MSSRAFIVRARRNSLKAAFIFILALCFPTCAWSEVVVTFFYRISPLTPTPPGYSTGWQFAHAFMRVQGQIDGQPINDVWGFYPTSSADEPKSILFHVPGSVYEPDGVDGVPSKENWDTSYPVVSVTISDESYHTLLNNINKWAADPSAYTALDRNCVAFTNFAAKELGLNVPDNPSILPYFFMHQLENLNPNNVYTSKSVNMGAPEHMSSSELRSIRSKYDGQDLKAANDDESKLNRAEHAYAQSAFSNVDGARRNYQGSLANGILTQNANEIKNALNADFAASQQEYDNQQLLERGIDDAEDGAGADSVMPPSEGGAPTPAAGDYDPNCIFTCFTMNATASLVRLPARMGHHRPAPASPHSVIEELPARAPEFLITSGDLQIDQPKEAALIAAKRHKKIEIIIPPEYFPTFGPKIGTKTGLRLAIDAGNYIFGETAVIGLSISYCHKDTGNVKYNITTTSDIHVKLGKSNTDIQSVTAGCDATPINIVLSIPQKADFQAATWVTPMLSFSTNGVAVSEIFVAYNLFDNDEVSIDLSTPQQIPELSSGKGNNLGPWYSLPLGVPPLDYEIEHNSVIGRVIGFGDDPRSCEGYAMCGMRWFGSQPVFDFAAQGKQEGCILGFCNPVSIGIAGEISAKFKLNRPAAHWLQKRSLFEIE